MKGWRDGGMAAAQEQPAGCLPSDLLTEKGLGHLLAWSRGHAASCALPKGEILLLAGCGIVDCYGLAPARPGWAQTQCSHGVSAESLAGSMQGTSCSSAPQLQLEPTKTRRGRLAWWSNRRGWWQAGWGCAKEHRQACQLHIASTACGEAPSSGSDFL